MLFLCQWEHFWHLAQKFNKIVFNKWMVQKISAHGQILEIFSAPVNNFTYLLFHRCLVPSHALAASHVYSHFCHVRTYSCLETNKTISAFTNVVWFFHTMSHCPTYHEDPEMPPTFLKVVITCLVTSKTFKSFNLWQDTNTNKDQVTLTSKSTHSRFLVVFTYIWLIVPSYCGS